MADNTKSFKIGCGSSTMFVVMFLILFTLKLAGIGVVKDWSWWWVTAPLWGVPAFFIGMLLVFLFGVFMAAVLSSRK